MVEPIGKAKAELMMKIQDACMSVIDPVLKEHVVPHLSKIVEVIQSPVSDAFEESFKLFQSEAFNKFELKGSVEENRKAFRELDSYPYSWEMYKVTRLVDVMYEPLWALNIIFEDIWPWSAIYDAHNLLRKQMDNAIYTYQKKIIEEQEKGNTNLAQFSDTLRAQLLEDYRTDSNQARVLYFAAAIKKIVYPPFTKILIPLAEKILSPFENSIPDPMKQFLDINDMFETICSRLVDQSIQTILASANR